MTTATVWSYHTNPGADPVDWGKLVGYEVEATDGHVGKIDKASADTGRNYIVVDTGFWIFGKERLIPAGVVARVDPEDHTVFVAMTKDLIRQAPDYDEEMTESYEEAYYDQQATYYEPFGP